MKIFFVPILYFYFRHDTNISADTNINPISARYRRHILLLLILRRGVLESAASSDITQRIVISNSRVTTCCVGVWIAVTYSHRAEELEQNGLICVRAFISEILDSEIFNPIFIFWQISARYPISISDCDIPIFYPFAINGIKCFQWNHWNSLFHGFQAQNATNITDSGGPDGGSRPPGSNPFHFLPPSDVSIAKVGAGDATRCSFTS